MKTKKLTLLIACAATVGLMATTAFATQATTQPTAPNAPLLNAVAETPEGTPPEDMPQFPTGGRFGQGMPELTEEQKAEMEARRAEMAAERTAREEAWNAMTDAQKEELYTLYDQSIDAEIAAADKSLSFGLISEEEATAMKENLQAKKAAIRENGALPFPGGKGHHGGGFGGRPMRNMAPPDDMTAADTQI